MGANTGEFGDGVGDDFVVDIAVLGSRARLVCHDQAAYLDLRRDWSRCLSSASDSEPMEIEVGESGRPVADRDLYAVTSQVTMRGIMDQAGRLLMIHACGLADDHGDVTALVGPSGSGKSTAARELCRERFGYVTDETLAVDKAGSVVPYPKPLSLHHGVTGGLKEQFGPDELGLLHHSQPLRLRRIVLLDRRAHGVTPRLTPVSLMDALIAIIPQTSALPSLDNPLQRLCDLIAGCGGTDRLTFTEIGEASHLLGERPMEDTEDWTPLVRSEQPRDDVSWMLRDGRVHPSPFADAVRIGDEALVLVARTPIRLSGIGLTIWEASHRGPSLEELTATVVAVHGPHPDAAALVRDAVDTLRSAGTVSFHLPRTAASLLASLFQAASPSDAGPEAARGV